MLADTQAEAVRLAEHILALKAYDLDVKPMVSGAINPPPVMRSLEVAKLYEATKVLADSLDLSLGETLRGGVSDGNLVACLGKPLFDGFGCSGAGAHARA